MHGLRPSSEKKLAKKKLAKSHTHTELAPCTMHGLGPSSAHTHTKETY